MNSLEFWDWLCEVAQSYVNREAIFEERRSIWYVRIAAVDILEDTFSATLEPLPTPGFTVPSKAFSVMVRRKNIAPRSHLFVSASGYVSWTLFTDPQVIATAVKLAAEEACKAEGALDPDEAETSPRRNPEPLTFLRNIIDSAAQTRNDSGSP